MSSHHNLSEPASKDSASDGRADSVDELVVPVWLRTCVKHWLPISALLFWFLPSAFLWFWESNTKVFDKSVFDWASVLSVYAGLVGLLVTALTFVYAFRGADLAEQNRLALEENQKSLKKSLEENQKSLIDHALLVGESLTDFATVFKTHLLEHLARFAERPGYIYLMLSSPAYGYGVLGEKKSEELAAAMGNLNAGCIVDIIYYSPEAHWLYWANTLLWSFVRDKFNNVKDFAVGFADALREARAAVTRPGHSKMRLWISDSGTQRLFGFKAKDETASPPPGSGPLETRSIDYVYVVITDKIELDKDQWSDRFYVRSHRVFRQHVKEYISTDNSVFERAKFCPYTAVTGFPPRSEKGAITELKEIDNLFADYLYGRTGQTFLHPLLDPSEKNRALFIQSAAHTIVLDCKHRFGKDAEHLDEGEYLRETLLQTLRFFSHLSSTGHGSSGQQQSKIQNDRIFGVAGSLFQHYNPGVPLPTDDLLQHAIGCLSGAKCEDQKALAEWLGDLLASGRATSLHFIDRTSEKSAP